jgi:hypothetical protein
MSSRRMSLLPRATLHSDSEQYWTFPSHRLGSLQYSQYRLESSVHRLMFRSEYSIKTGRFRFAKVVVTGLHNKEYLLKFGWS